MWRGQFSSPHQTHRIFEECTRYEPLAITSHYYFPVLFQKQSKKREKTYMQMVWKNSNERSCSQSSPPLQSECYGTSKCQHKCQLQNHKQRWVFEEDIWQSQKGQRPACLTPFSYDYIFLDHCTVAMYLHVLSLREFR